MATNRKMKHEHTGEDLVHMAGHLLEHNPTTGCHARNADGRRVPMDDTSACSWCLFGALRKCMEALGVDWPPWLRYSDSIEWDNATDAERLQLARDMQQWDGVSTLRIRFIEGDEQ